MYANYFLINQAFLDRVSDKDRQLISDYAYSQYVKLHRNKYNLLSKSEFFLSNRTRTVITYLYCPKCKENSFVVMHSGHKAAHGLKFCHQCGEPSIDYRFSTGKEKIISMLQLSSALESEYGDMAKTLNQQIIALISSVYEVYLRDFYADILNSRFVKFDQSLYQKFIRDCRNDFLNPGKTQSRLKSDLGINYKQIIGEDVYKALILLSDYRNVIVHNNGICDTTFVNAHPDCELGATIAPKSKSAKLFFYTIETSVKKLDEIYQTTLIEWASQNICSRVMEISSKNS